MKEFMNTNEENIFSSTQYASADNLHARWNLYDFVRPKVDIHKLGIEHLHLGGLEDVLEVGCGDGSVLTGLRQSGHCGKLVGMDLNENMFKTPIGMTDSINGLLPIEYSVGSADQLSYPDKSFDIVLAFFMLYHMPDIQKTLREWKRVLKDDGKLLVATSSQYNKPKQKIFKKMAETLTRKTAPSQFSSSFNMENAREQLARVFRIKDVYTYKGNIEIQNAEPYLQSFLSTKDLYQPPLLEDEWNLVENNVRLYIEEEIKQTGIFTDYVERDFYICEKY